MAIDDKKRTIQQNSALHLYFQLVADTLNDAGYDMRRTLAADVDIPWSKETVKEYLWRPIQAQQLLKISTKELSTKDIDLLLDTITRFLATKGIYQEFPSIENLLDKVRDNDFRDLN